MADQWISEHHAAPTSDAPGSGPRAAEGASTLARPAQWFTDFLTGNPGGERGVIVNEFTALNYAALYSCVSLIASTVASLPLKVFRARADGGREEAPERPEWDRLQVEFNPNTSAMTGRETGLGHLLTWGNSYCQIVRNRLPSRDVIRLQPLGPDIVCPDTNDRGELVYEVYDRSTGKVETTLAREDVLHVPGMSFDAMVGYSLVKIAKTVIRTGMAQDREAEQFVNRGIRPPGAIRFQAGRKFADDEQAAKFRNSFRKVHAGDDGALNVVILEDGAEWQSLGIDPESAQLLESRKFSPQEICAIYHVPPHMVALVEKVSSWGTGIEEMTIGFVVYCLLPILRRIEQEYNRKLFRGAPGVFCEHVLSGLLRGDTLKQAQAIEIYMRNGLLTVNESRRLLGWNPLAGGNVRYYPLNFGRVDEDGNDMLPAAAEKPAPEPARAPVLPAARHQPGPNRAELAGALRAAVVAAAGRCLRKEAAEAQKAARKPEAFLAWIESFYGKHAEMLVDQLDPLAASWRAAFGTEGYGPAAHAERSRADLLAASECKPSELLAAVERVAERWTAERLVEIGANLQPSTQPAEAAPCGTNAF